MASAVLTPSPFGGVSEDRVKELIRSTPGMGATVTTLFEITLRKFNVLEWPAHYFSGNVPAGATAKRVYFTMSMQVNDYPVSIAIINNKTLTQYYQTFGNFSTSFSEPTEKLTVVGTDELGNTAGGSSGRYLEIKGALIDGNIMLSGEYGFKYSTGSVVTNTPCQVTHTIAKAPVVNPDFVNGTLTIQASY